MNTDEYEISFLRELDVCRGYIKAIEQSLGPLEERHGKKAEQAIADLRSGRAVDHDGELAAWAAQLEALERWRKRETDYEALLRAARMKG